MVERIDVAVIGGGQAGLSTSHELAARGVEHVVLERGRIGETWRGRWETFCLVTPNWSIRLPGHPYDGDDPDGFLPRDDIVGYLERYAAAAGAPVREGIEVTALERATGSGFRIMTSDGEMQTKAVVVATGTFRRPHRPPGAVTLPADTPQIDVEQYRSPAELPSGAILIVGSGQSGCQIAEEMIGSGREVFLACGRAAWLTRRIGEHDLVWWGLETGFLDQTLEDLPTPGARLAANVLATGHEGGHDLHLRTLQGQGVTLLGHFLEAKERRARFADDLAASVAWGDDRHREFMSLVAKVAAERGIPQPAVPEPPPFDGVAPLEIDLSNIGAVIFAGGFRPDFASWIRIPGAFDEMGFPIQVDGASSVAPGLYFVGVHFLRKRKSSFLSGVGEDAAIVAGAIAAEGSGR